MSGCSLPPYALRIIHSRIRVADPGSHQEDDQVVVGMSESQNPFLAATVQEHPAATARAGPAQAFKETASAGAGASDSGRDAFSWCRGPRRVRRPQRGRASDPWTF
ncbi:hypothetical protein GCM10023323_66550 [Streptomyces thinghirensis]|uniref:Uncharacterized protein n=1 Tax=Streptomyces thinghirensis TaxID=551547 RepID=A0ABP9TEU5_9ACTN